jgi:xylose dehydrogenase (NAD/NADP)
VTARIAVFESGGRNYIKRSVVLSDTIPHDPGWGLYCRNLSGNGQFDDPEQTDAFSTTPTERVGMSASDRFESFARRDWDTGTDGTVAFAVVGLGGYARNVSLPAVADGDYATVGAVVSGDPAKAAETAEKYDARALNYEEYDAGEATDSYDAVYVATPNRKHLSQVETAAEYGKHAIVEKPLDATADRAREVVETCAAADVRLMTAYRMQTDPAIRRVREMLADGLIGEPVKLFGDFTFPVLGGSRGPDQWRLDDHLAGGGALYDVGVYPLNTARFLLDEDPVAVSATASGEGAFADVDEHTHFHVEFSENVIGNFSASFSGHGSTFLTVIGTDGKIEIENAFGPAGDREVRIETAEGTATFDGLGADETREEFDYFAHAILADAEIEPDGEDGLTDLRVMEAIQDAAESGTRQALDD